MDNRVWASGAAASPPTAPAAPSVGYPTAGDPLIALPATKGGAYWFHQLGEELRAIQTAAGITPDEANLTQLLSALRSAGVFTTPALFDNSTKVATTEFANRLLLLSGGWIADINAWTYVSASTFSVPGDQTAIFKKGTKIKWFQTTPHYGYVASSSFGGVNTVVAIVVNTDHVIANAAITLPAYSYASSPVGFPSRFSYNSTVAGLTVTTFSVYFTLSEGLCHLTFAVIGTSNQSGFTLTAPVPCANTDPSGNIYGNTAAAYDNGTWQTSPAALGIGDASSTIQIGKDATRFNGNVFGGFTASGGKAIQGGFSFPF